MLEFPDESKDSIILSSVRETDVDQNNSGWTPLIRACRYGQTDQVSHLVASGADVTICDNLGWNAVPFAVASGNIATVTEILKAKKWSREELAPALCLSALNGHYDMAEILLNCHANPNTPVKDSEITPLMLAAGEGDVKMITLLLSKGADPDKTNALHQTALDAAVCRGHLNAQSILAPVTHLRSKISSHIPLPISPPNKALQLSPDRTQACNCSPSAFQATSNRHPVLSQIASPCQGLRPHLDAFHLVEPCSTPLDISRKLHLQSSPICRTCSPRCRPTHDDFVLSHSPFLIRNTKGYLSPFPAFCSSDAGYSSRFPAGVQRKLDDYCEVYNSPFHKGSGYCRSDNVGGQISKSPQKISVRQEQKIMLRCNKSFRKWWCQMKKRCKGVEQSEEDARFTLNDDRWHEKRLINFLRSIKMTEYISLFTSQEVDFETFLTLKDTDLEEIGIKNPSHRFRIMNKVSKFRACALNNEGIDNKLV